MKIKIILMYLIIPTISLFAQNSVQTWIQAINKAISALEAYNNTGTSPYSISESTDFGHIVYDVYGADVKIAPNGDAIITGQASTGSVNTIYNAFFEQMLYTYGRPIKTEAASTVNGGITSALFSGEYNSTFYYTYELQLLAFESKISLIRHYALIKKSEQKIVGSEDNNNDGFYYKVIDSEIAITGYNGDSKDITIPSTIDGLSVTRIGYKALSRKKIKSVKLPNTIIYIAEEAFSMNELEEITIPNSVVTIGDGAFFTNRLSSLTIPNSVKIIGSAAFNSNRLTSIDIPKIKIIEINTFVYNKLTSVVIPDTVTEIKDGAFSQNPILHVTISDSVTKIGLAFAFCNIVSVKIGPNVNIAWNNYRDAVNGPFGFSFKMYYDQNQKRAGTYKFENSKWHFSEQ